MLDFQLNYPQLGSEGALLDEFLHALAPAERAALLAPRPATGLPADREAAAEYLTELGLPVSADRVFLASGGHHAVTLLLIATGLHGQPIAVDERTYSNFITLAAQHRIPLLPCAMDADGMLPDSLARALQGGARAVYIMPTLHNPLGMVMPIARRRELAAIAAQSGAWIFEDDAYAFLEPSPPPPVSAFAPEQGCYIDSFSKPFSPVLKTAMLAVPAALAPKIETTALLSGSGTPLLFSAFARQLIRSGQLAEIVTAKRAEGARRQARARTFLPACRITAHPNSYHLWIEPERVSADDLVTRTRERGLAISSGRSYTPSQAAPPNAVRIALAGESDLARVEQGLRILQDCLSEG
jgi:DNA-binding transcriptional MocR family regulator